MWPLNHKAGKVLLLIVVIATAAVLYNPLAQLFLAGRLLLAVREVVAGDTGTSLAVKETKVQRSRGSEKLEGILYEPSRSRPRSGVCWTPGGRGFVSAPPRLVPRSRTLAPRDSS